MRGSTVVLGALLAISLATNAALLARRPVPPPERRAPEPVRTKESDSFVRLEAPIRTKEPDSFVRPVEPPKATKVPESLAAAPSPTPVRSDPEIAAVLDAQEQFGVLWKDLDRLFRAQARIEEAKYLETVLGTTIDFLRLPPERRVAFQESALTSARLLVAARRERDQARAALPPKDKTNPVYQQQKDAVDQRYQEQTRSAVDRVKAHLDVAQPRHAEFASSLEKWLRNLAPRTPN